MASHAATEEAAGTAGRWAFVRARVASFLAIAPLGVWTVVHVWNNLAAVRGAEAWQAAVTRYDHPGGIWLTGVVVLLPLAIHTAWGIGRLFSSRPNNVRYGFFDNLKYLLQRASAVGVLAFLGAHLWLAFIEPRFVEGHPESFANLSHEMRHHGPTLVVYVLGTLGVAYHLANGINGFAMGWGLAGSRASLRRVERASMLFFVVLLAMSWGAVAALWAAGA